MCLRKKARRMHDFRTNSAGQTSGTTTPSACVHGQAALLLVETLMHALITKRVITREDFIEIVEGAAEVEEELALAQASSPCVQSGSLLRPMAAAFQRELGL